MKLMLKPDNAVDLIVRLISTVVEEARGVDPTTDHAQYLYGDGRMIKSIESEAYKTGGSDLVQHIGEALAERLWNELYHTRDWSDEQLHDDWDQAVRDYFGPHGADNKFACIVFMERPEPPTK